MHLRWMLPKHLDGPIVEVSATLTIVQPPAVERLYFWALQATFEHRGQRFGGGHLGLQWHPGHPGRTAANWGGYHAGGGGELSGTESPRPSVRGNANTRDFDWVPERPYRLTIRRSAGGDGWAGLVDDEELRVLHVGGGELTNVMVWSEVFARCDNLSVTVRWSDLEAVTSAGTRVRPEAVLATYQSRADGGCDNTTAVLVADTGAIEQVTATPRVVADRAVLRLTPPM